ncbi:hypothetical protein FSP39_015610 [Pinctada imbricata]|uniref:Autophagy-related protein 27 n=1 Tax=Pinctada imbricata TaxID=66713 RepID=A0AA88YVH4_PINIB|nr:hypothetical protein FSP39_015610 [Pinctada imbricata]
MKILTIISTALTIEHQIEHRRTPCKLEVGQGAQKDFPDNYATDGYFYSYNPCSGFNEGSCSNVAGCQVSGDQASQYTIADPTSATFSYDGTNAHVAYSHTDGSGFQRNFDVTLQCDQTADPPTFVASGEGSTGQYSATLTSKCACPNVCGSAPPPQTTTHSPGHNGGSGGVEEGGLTIGSWLCIIFFSVAFLYIVGGIVIQKGVRKANGKEVMPNSSFWLAFPGLVKACQVSGDQSAQYIIGDPSSATFSFDGTNVHIAYAHTDDTGFQRLSRITTTLGHDNKPLQKAITSHHYKERLHLSTTKGHYISPLHKSNISYLYIRSLHLTTTQVHHNSPLHRAITTHHYIPPIHLTTT